MKVHDTGGHSPPVWTKDSTSKRFTALIAMVVITSFLFGGCNGWVAAYYDGYDKGYVEGYELGACVADYGAGFTYGKIDAEIEYDNRVRKMVALVQIERNQCLLTLSAMAGVE